MGSPALEQEGSSVAKPAGGASTKKRRPSTNPRFEYLYGCSSCDYAEAGCARCRRAPRVARPKARWDPPAGVPQTHIPEAPTFYPTAEEFADPFAFLQSIAPKAAAGGIALIVPPEGWAPTSRLVDPVTGRLRTDFSFPVRKQPTHLLCRRHPTADGGPPEEEVEQQEQEGKGSPEGGGGSGGKQGGGSGGKQGGSGGGSRMAAAGGRMVPAGSRMAPASGGRMGPAAPPASALVKKEEGDGGDADDEEGDGEEEGGGDDQFGYDMLSAPLDLPTFKRYADWAKRCHFSSTASAAAGKAARSSAGARRQAAGAGAGGYKEPSVDEIEAEFWRIVEVSNEQVEALYGQDVDSASYGSGFHTRSDEARAALSAALPPRRTATMAEAGAARAAVAVAFPARGGGEGAQQQAPEGAGAAAAGDERSEEDQEQRRQLRQEELLRVGAEAGRCTAAAQSCALAAAGAGPAAGVSCGSCHHCRLKRYAHHPWNVNNVPLGRDSVLRFVKEQVDGKPITGVMVPWLYIGSCFSAFCWHIEDHGLYSINYHHMGQPKVWYAVPGSAAARLDAVMADALPHLFQRDPQLLHKLVTMLSPSQLAARGVPVCRAVHRAGSFVVTFPDAYHAGFNTGFNVAEAVNFAAPDWVPFGSESVQRYRAQLRPMTFSHDAMLVNVLRGALEAAAAPAGRADGGGGVAAAAAAAAIAAIDGEGAGGAAAAALAPALDRRAAELLGPEPEFELEPAKGAEAEATEAEGAAENGGKADSPSPPPPAAAASGGSPHTQQHSKHTQQRQCIHAMRAAPPSPGGAAAAAAALRVVARAAAVPPPHHVSAAALGELAVRVRELRRQLRVAAERHAVRRARLMVGPAAAEDPLTGVSLNTQGMECSYCGGDLSMASVISGAAPGAATCAEHADHLPAPPASRRLLLRHAPGLLEALLAAAAAVVPGGLQAMARALNRVAGGSNAGQDLIERLGIKPWPLVSPPAWAVAPHNSRKLRQAEAAAAAAAEDQRAAKREGNEEGPGAEAAAAAVRRPKRRQEAAAAAGAAAFTPASSASGLSAQEPGAAQQQQQQQQQQPRREQERERQQQGATSAAPSLKGRLYDPTSLSLKLFWDLEDSDYDEIEAWEAAAARDGGGGNGDGSDERSSGSWWDDGAGGAEEDEFGFVSLGRRKGEEPDAGAIDNDSSDGDFGTPSGRRRGGRRARRRRGGATAAARREGRRKAAARPAAAAAAEKDGCSADEEEEGGQGLGGCKRLSESDASERPAKRVAVEIEAA